MADNVPLPMQAAPTTKSNASAAKSKPTANYGAPSFVKAEHKVLRRRLTVTWTCLALSRAHTTHRPPLQYQTLADKAKEEEEEKDGDEVSKPQQQQQQKTMQQKFPQFYGGAFVSGGAFVLGASTKDSTDSGSSDSSDSDDSSDEEKNYASGLNENDLLAVCGGRVRFGAVNQTNQPTNRAWADQRSSRGWWRGADPVAVEVPGAGPSEAVGRARTTVEGEP